MKKKAIACVLTAACLSLGVLAGCGTVSIRSIEKTGSLGLVDYYTITYSDGTTTGFTVTNGRDGTDGKDATEFSVQELYDFYIANGGSGDIEEFIEKFSLTTEKAVTPSAFKSCLLSSMKLYSIFKESSRNETGYAGSGVIYKMEDDYTYIVTNYHVVYDNLASGNKISQKIYGYMYGSEGEPKKVGGVYTADSQYAINCEYVGGSIVTDVAVIRARTSDVLAKNPSARAATLNCEYSVQDRVYAVGNPDDGGISITGGVISVDSEYVTLAIDDKTRSYRSIRTDAGLNHGSSGGGLFNENGELIGITNSGDTVTVNGEEIPIAGQNFAIPATIVKGIADGILYYYFTEGISHTKTVYLGMSTEEKNSRYVYDPETGKSGIVADIYVTAVEHSLLNGIFTTSGQKVAKAIGLKAGDKLTGFYVNGTRHEVDRIFTVKELLYTLRIGDKVNFSYERDGKEETGTEYRITAANLVNPDELVITE